MTAGEFSQYRAIILGDPTCRTGYLNTPIANRNVWGPVVNGNIFIIGSDPTFHASSRPGAAEVIRSGVKFAADAAGKTGAYITLSCDANAAPVLNGLSSVGTFTTGPAPCGANVAKVANHPALATLTASSLSGWGCSVHESFNTWPSDFDVLAIALDGANTYTAPDGTKGTPYVLARGEGLVVVSDIQIAPGTQSLTVNQPATLTATVKSNGNPVVGTTVTFTAVDGPDAGASVAATTNAAGEATATFVRSTPGTNGYRATFVDALTRTQTSGRAAIEWTVPADATAPVITPTITGPQGDDDWYIGDVNVSWTVVDDESPITSQTGCTASSVTADVASVSFTCTATSTGGTASKTVTIMRDASAPLLDAVVSGPQGANGWYTGTVTVTWNKSDPTSGVPPFHSHEEGAVDPCLDRTVTSNTAGTTFSCTIENGAGLTTTKSVFVKRDASAPTVAGAVSGTMGNNGWYVSDVTVSWTTADDVSGATPCASNFLTADNAGASFSCTTTNGAGMTATGNVTGIKRDATKPVVGFSGNAGSYTVDQNVAITCAASDNLSGIAGTTGCSTISGAAYSFAIGNNGYTATATDKAGNSSSASTSFTVTVNGASLCALISRFVDNAGVANSMCVKVNAQSWNALQNELSAQSGKKISAANAAILSALVDVMASH
jgi:hypothetical protein